MAPKAMKRPAASGRASAGKRFRAGSSKVDRCRTVSDAIAGFEELPEVVRSMLADLVVPGFATKETERHPYQTVAVEMLSETLDGMEASLFENLRTAQAKVDGAEIDRQAREERVCLAEVHLMKLKEALVARKEEMFEAEKAVEQATSVLTSREAEQREVESKLRSNMAKLGQLEVAEQTVFRPFKEAPAGGKQAGKSLRDLRKVGKDFGFHDVLMNSIPDILRKEPERRQTFDDLALKQMEVEFSRNISSYEAVVKESEQGIATCIAVANNAKAAQAAAVQRCSMLARTLTEADTEITEAKEALEVAKRHLRDFKKDMKAASESVKSCKAKLDAFRAGPLNAFQELGGPLKSPAPSQESKPLEEAAFQELPLKSPAPSQESRPLEEAADSEATLEATMVLCETKADALEGSGKA